MEHSQIGGSNDDAAYVLDISPVNGELLVAGGTSSSDFPGNKTGVVQPGFGGAIDGWVAQLQDNGTSVSLVRSTFIGTGAIDQIYGIQFDKFGFPYIMGTTLSSAWPHINAPYFVGGAKQFIGKLQPDLSAYALFHDLGNDPGCRGSQHFPGCLPGRPL